METERFFADPNHQPAAEQAKLICASCEVREPCLEYALAEGIDVGIWGGLDARERAALGRRRAAATVQL